MFYTLAFGLNHLALPQTHVFLWNVFFWQHIFCLHHLVATLLVMIVGIRFIGLESNKIIVEKIGIAC